LTRRTHCAYGEYMRMTGQAWQRTADLAARDGLDDAQIAGLAIGCPAHGNAGMDWDDDGVYCQACDVAATAAARGSK
jgi:hypothetical protein